MDSKVEDAILNDLIVDLRGSEDKKKETSFERNLHGHFICPYKDECSYTTARRHNLEIHVRIHTNQYSFECKICKKGQESIYVGTVCLHNQDCAENIESLKRLSYETNVSESREDAR